MLPFLNSLDPDRVPTFKLIVHLAQILLIFVIWCLEINVFVDGKAKITGENGWTFGAVRDPFCEISASRPLLARGTRTLIWTLAFRDTRC